MIHPCSHESWSSQLFFVRALQSRAGLRCECVICQPDEFFSIVVQRRRQRRSAFEEEVGRVSGV
eukprot:2298055-Pyramimonas_sp.AAC.1